MLAQAVIPLTHNVLQGSPRLTPQEDGQSGLDTGMLHLPKKGILPPSQFDEAVDVRGLHVEEVGDSLLLREPKVRHHEVANETVRDALESGHALESRDALLDEGLAS